MAQLTDKVELNQYGQVRSDVLDQLAADKIFNVFFNRGLKAVTFEEACDEHFRSSLDKKELGKLIKELQDIHDILED